MAKRPSAASTRSKQHQVLRYIYSTSLKTASTDYNVSTSKLRQFVKGNPRYLKGRIAKDPVYQSLYKSDLKQIAKSHKTKLIPKLSRRRYYELERKIEKNEPLTQRQKLAKEYRTTTKVREYQISKKGKVSYRPIAPTQIQTQESRMELELRGLGTYTSRESVKTGFESGSLSSSQVRSIVNLWQETYGFNDDHVDELLEEIIGDSTLEDAEQE